MTKLLSIVIPAFNVAHYIEKTLLSIMEQADERVELIVVNDGSTDNTSEIVKSCYEKFPDLDTALIEKKNGGVSTARNRGLQECTGEYVLFFDGDDILTTNSLAMFFSVLSNETYDYVCFGYDDYYDDYETKISDYKTKYGYLEDRVTPSSLLTRFLLDDGVYLHICSSIFRRKIIQEKQLMFSVGVKLGEDTEFVLKALSMCKIATQIKHSSFLYIQRPTSATHTMKKTLEGDPFVGVKKQQEILAYWINAKMAISVIETMKHVKIPMSTAIRLLHLCKDVQLDRKEYVSLVRDSGQFGLLSDAKKPLFMKQKQKKYYLIKLLSLNPNIAWLISKLFSIYRN